MLIVVTSTQLSKAEDVVTNFDIFSLLKECIWLIAKYSERGFGTNFLTLLLESCFKKKAVIESTHITFASHCVKT